MRVKNLTFFFLFTFTAFCSIIYKYLLQIDIYSDEQTQKKENELPMEKIKRQKRYKKRKNETVYFLVEGLFVVLTRELKKILFFSLLRFHSSVISFGIAETDNAMISRRVK